MKAIQIRGLTKDFKVGFWRRRPFRALDNLTLDVEQGEVFGLLGPNGAGKTTTLKTLVRLIYPTAGEARILGKPISDVSVRSQIGYLPENPFFYDHLTAEEFLLYCAALFGCDKLKARSKVDELLELLGLSSARRIQLRKFSKGMLQRIGIAQAIINDPKVLLLDEPMSGLDPVGRRQMRQIIRSLRNYNVTIFFSSHILADVEAICDRVAILNRGRLVDVGSLTDMLGLQISAMEIIAAGLRPEAVQRLKQVAAHCELLGDRVQLRTDGSDNMDAAISLIRDGGGKLISINPVRESLEDFFFKRIDGGSKYEGSAHSP